MHDVVIAGGGPAGAATALLLAREGLDVAIVERAAFPRTKACGEYLSPATVRELCALGVEGGVRGHAAPIRGIRLYNGGARAELRLHSPAWSLSRATLDDALFSAAIRAGAKPVRARVEDVLTGEDCAGVCVRLPDGALDVVEGRMLIGADGAHSIVARICGLAVRERRERRFALGGHYRGFSGLDGFVEMFVDGRSYFAVNPFSGSRANVMVIVEEPDLQRRRNDVDAFVRERAASLSGGRRTFTDASLEGSRIAVGPLEHRTHRYTAARTLLVGDAAQFVDPFTGQGVYLALHGARLAAQAVCAVLRGGSGEAAARERYERELGREVRRRRRLARAASALVRMPWLAPYAAAFSPLLRAIAE